MKPKQNSVSSKLKNIYTTCFLMTLVGLVFLGQCFLIYRVYTLSLDSLTATLATSAREVYNAGLDLRVQKVLLNDTLPLSSVCHKDGKNFNLSGLKDNVLNISDQASSVSSIDIEVEEYLKDRIPIDLQELDSIANIVLHKHNLDFNFYTEIIDPKTNEVLRSTMPQVKMSFRTMESEAYPINKEQTKALRIALINPLDSLYRQLVLLGSLFFALFVVLLFTFYYQRKLLTRQKQLVEAKNDLFADISHEMKRPLSVMSLVISSLEKEQILKDEKKRTSFLSMAREEISRMSNQTEMVLNLSKDDEEAFELNCTSFNILEMVSDLADKYIYMADKEVEIEIDDQIADPSIFADPQHIEHIITNLLTNSIKYSHEPVFIRISLYYEDECFCVSVKDNGVGMTKEQQSHVFERYYRTGTVSRAKGYGIGLSYVDRVVKKCNGRIVLISEPNKGSEFIIKLPLQVIS